MIQNLPNDQCGGEFAGLGLVTYHHPMGKGVRRTGFDILRHDKPPAREQRPGLRRPKQRDRRPGTGAVLDHSLEIQSKIRGPASGAHDVDDVTVDLRIDMHGINIIPEPGQFGGREHRLDVDLR